MARHFVVWWKEFSSVVTWMWADKLVFSSLSQETVPLTVNGGRFVYF